MMLSDINNLQILSSWANANGIKVHVDTWFPEGNPVLILKFVFPVSFNAEYSYMIDLQSALKTGQPELEVGRHCTLIADKLDQVLRAGGLF